MASPPAPAASDHDVVETSALTKRFGQRTAVAGVDLRVPAGCAFGFLGPNGAGKTTLIRMLLGLIPASAGEMKLLGQPVPAERATALRRVGAIVEEPRFHGHLTGRENLRCAAAARGHETFARIEPGLERVGLLDRADDRVKSYSLGMRQRLGIARCLLSDPALLILDEPMNGLDPAGILEMRGFIRDFVEEGRTVFLSSHLLDEVERTCDQIAIIDRGEVVIQGAISDIATAQDQVLVVGCDRPEDAAQLLRERAEVAGSAVEGDELRLRLAPGAHAIAVSAAVNRRLVESGIEVHRLEPSHVSLEERFLEITSRLGEDS
jgi:ABC-2 type transport system ATP-binding protein